LNGCSVQNAMSARPVNLPISKLLSHKGTITSRSLPERTLTAKR